MQTDSISPDTPLGPSKRGVKIQDVARLAQVSLSTVSGVLNGKTNIRPETRQRVLDVIVQVGYRPNVFASNLARHKTRILGIVISDLLNPFFAEIGYALETEGRRRGYETFLLSTGFSEEQQRAAVRQMTALRVAGLAMMTSENDPEAFAALKLNGTAAVYLDNSHLAPTVGTVGVDKRHGMFLAVTHLLELGHRKILLVKNSDPRASHRPIFSVMERQLGFDEAVRLHNSKDIEVHVCDEPGSSTAAGFAAIQKALRTYEFTAVVAANDLIALGVLHGLQAAKLRIPKDISVVGFDNMHLSEHYCPPLTTVATPRAELARAVLDMLLAIDRQEEVDRERLLEAHLVIRESTAAPNKTRISKPRII